MRETANNLGDIFEKSNDTEQEQEFNMDSIIHNVDMADFVSINIKFRIISKNVKLYSDKQLMNQIFSVQLQIDEIVEGQYIGSTAILLDKLGFFLKSSDVKEVPIDIIEAIPFYT